MVSTASPVPLLTPEQTAELLGVAVQTLSVWRSTARYPLPYIKVGRNVRYSRADVQQYLDRATVRTMMPSEMA